MCLLLQVVAHSCCHGGATAGPDTVDQPDGSFHLPSLGNGLRAPLHCCCIVQLPRCQAAQQTTSLCRHSMIALVLAQIHQLSEVRLRQVQLLQCLVAASQAQASLALTSSVWYTLGQES